MKRIVNGLVGLGVWLGASAPAGAQPHPGEPARKTEEVGSWLAACVRDTRPGPPACDIRHRTWLLPPSAGHVSAALEIGLRHGVAVPVVTLRGVSIPDATGTLLALATGVTVQFGADPPRAGRMRLPRPPPPVPRRPRRSRRGSSTWCATTPMAGTWRCR